MSRVRTISLLLLFSFMLTIGCAIKYNKISTLPTKDQASFFKDGRQVVVSRKPNSIVTIAPSQEAFPVDTRPSFIIVVNNLSTQPVTFSTENVAFNMDGKELQVFSYQELVQEIEQQRRSAATTQALIGALGILGASMEGGRTYHSGTYQSQNTVGTYSGTTYSPLATLQAQTTFGAMTANNIAAINSAAQGQLNSVQNSVLKKETVLPNTWYGGYVRIANLAEPETLKSIKSTITVGKDVHEFLFTLAQDGQGLQKTQRIKGETVSDDRAPTLTRTDSRKGQNSSETTNQQALLSKNWRVQFEKCRKSAEKGIPDAQFQLGMKYSDGIGVPENDNEAVKWLRKAAEQDHVGAQFKLGTMYTKGEGVTKNLKEAAKWYQKAAEQGNAFAQLVLGGIYERGSGVEKDYDIAAKWYQKAEDQGFELAKGSTGDLFFKIGGEYYTGQGVPLDYVKAKAWFEKAAGRKNADAYCALGMMHYYGHGVRKDYHTAAEWFMKAAEAGDVEAQFRLGRMYMKGEGVQVNYNKSAKLFRMVAENSSAGKQSIGAQVMLGLMYAEGLGVEKNYSEARKWYSKAAIKGNEQARYYLANLFETVVFPGWKPIVINATGIVLINTKKIRKEGELVWFWEVAVSFDGWKQTGDYLILFCAVDCAREKIGIANRYLYDSNNELIQSSLLKESEIRREDFMEPISPGSSGEAALKYVCEKSTQFQDRDDLTKSRVSFGTGWPVAAGFVVTSNHVISEHSKISLIRTDGTRIPARVVLQDKSNDLALLQAEDVKLLPPALPLSSSPARIGAKVITIGYPHPDILGSKPKLTEGVVSATSGAGDDPRVLQISVPVQAGNSGGPLINMEGEVVGVVMAKLNAVKIFKWTGDLPQNVNYAIKVPYLTGLLSSAPVNHAMKKLRIPKALSIEDIAAQIKDSVLLVVAE